MQSQSIYQHFCTITLIIKFKCNLKSTQLKQSWKRTKLKVSNFPTENKLQGLWFKMVEQKQVHSFPPARAQNHNELFNNMDRRTLEPTKKRYPMSKDKEVAVRQQEGHVNGEFKYHPTRWVTHKLDSNNTKKVLPLLWRFWTPHQAAQPGTWQKDWEFPGNLIFKANGIWLEKRLPQDWGNQRLQSWRIQNLECTKTQRKGAVTPPETEPKPPASPAKTPEKAWVGKGSQQEQQGRNLLPP